MKYFITSVLLFCCSLLLNAVAGQVQATTGMIGVVRSVDNQVLAKAAVTVVHIPTGTKRLTTTDATGKFSVEELAVGGPYTVQVSQPEYQTETINDIFLLTGQTANGTFVLHPEEKKAVAKKSKSRGAAEKAPLVAATATGAAATPNRYHLTYIQQCRIIPSAAAPAARTTSSTAPRTMPVTASTAPVAATASPVAGPGNAAAAGAGKISAPAPTGAPVSRTAAPAANSAAPGGAGMQPAAGKPIAYAGPAAVGARPSAASAANPKARYAYTPRPATRIAPPSVNGHYDAASGNYIYETGALTTLQLANGHKVTGVGVNSTENFLYKFISDPKAQIDTVNLSNGWLSFDRVYFDSGKATLTKESLPQLQNIAALMKAYPNIRLKIGGYTDSTGTYKMNRQLSEARARTAWAALVDMGVSPSRLDARGYGPNYPVASNQTEVGRAMNRRLSVKVLQK